jgi:hypothetical protein
MDSGCCCAIRKQQNSKTVMSCDRHLAVYREIFLLLTATILARNVRCNTSFGHQRGAIARDTRSVLADWITLLVSDFQIKSFCKRGDRDYLSANID